MLQAGDMVFHPRHGFGTVNGLTHRDPLQPQRDIVPGGCPAAGSQEYYDIALMDGGTLLIPVDRAERAGLRRLTNGIDAITACLRSPAAALPTDARKRAAELAVRGQLTEPMALAVTVRDMVVQSRGRSHTASEKAWLRKACARLSTEAALVDRISRSEASAAILEIVTHLSEP